MKTYPRPFDVIVEFTLSPRRQSAWTQAELRAPLFADPGHIGVGYGIVLGLEGQVPINPGETRQAPGFFLNAMDARDEFPSGAQFSSFEVEGRVVRWLSHAQVAAAE